MDPVLLARIQFALTVGFHYIFPPLTIGMAWMIFWIFTRWWRTGELLYRSMARFWLRLFSLSFIVGIATGIVMEFQFGTNWAGYSRFVGDIFGAPLAAEGILAFFLESTFLAVLVYGEKRVTLRARWFASLMVAVGSTLSGFWIIVANSWQQTPAGYKIENGRAVLTDFWAAVFNPSTIQRYLHTIDAALATGSAFMLGVSAWYLLKQRHEVFARQSLKMSLLLFFVSSLGQQLLGHYQAVQVTHTQPAKLAAFEGLFETQANAPLLLLGLPNYEEERTDYEVELPGVLSLVVGFSRDTVVQGLKDFPKDEWPPLLLTFFPFHLMVALGMFFIAFSSLGVFLLWRNKLFDNRLYLWGALLIVPLPFIANELGWICAEVGRQPWIVYGLLKTRDAISLSVPASHILLSIIGFTLIYALLFALWLFLLRLIILAGPEPTEAEPAWEVET